MSEQHDVVQRLDQQQEDEQEFLAEDDVLEVEELDQDQEGVMEVESGDEGDEGDDQDGGDEPRDDAMTMLDNGLDDSFVHSSLHQGAVFCLAVHPASSSVAVSGGEDDLAYIFRTDTGAQLAKLSGHSDSVTSVGWNFDGSMVATGGMDGKVRVWRAVGSQPWEERQWEFLTNLEGPDEVNVSCARLASSFSTTTDLTLSLVSHSGSTGTRRATCYSQEAQMAQYGGRKTTTRGEREG